ncbi:TetR/AcrR family transcriptional regulator [Chelatococcus sp. SYSU_G07232]|uniref:TetR/AcrR family transcriptional regulator n=1 Tax=Chelatococcus albus TaxID=3047466 RepID=A0ABT7AN66_9HYPH|nr:TetR/AcrR family transcriptional regulator [Chelatococcus sp. SYSU_G07232]MDJ1160254.1 TetR/AcrR family transcriptional regulator [Chelatococcus sp. SYSU_G07232]
MAKVADAGREAAASSADGAKRRQILEGARQVFRAEGFDGASMGEIARTAGVSKGTLYVYFDSKEALFEALVTEDRREAAERLFQLDANNPDVRGALLHLGSSLIAMMARPEHISILRMVMGAAEKFPRIGRAFYEAGPCHGRARLGAYLAAQHATGRVNVPDPELAAVQFLNLCKGDFLTAHMFGVGEPITPDAAERVVTSAVDVFFAAYGPKTG